MLSVGTRVFIKDPWIGDWGVVVAISDPYYHISVYGGRTHVLLTRDEFVVPRRRKGEKR